jgi:Leucine-rich repeat (LRR) protein
LPLRALSMLNPGPLTGLERLEDLEELDIRYSIKDQLVDLSGALGHLAKLRRLSLSGASNPVLHVELGHTPLPHGLESFSCYSCALTDPSALGLFPSIERIFLMSAATVDLAALRDPARLKEISVFTTNLKNVEVLRASVRLERATLKVSGVPSLAFLVPLKRLRYLEAFAPDFASTRVLASLTRLEELVINVLDSVEVVRGMRHLQILLVNGAVAEPLLGEGLVLPFLRQLDIRGGKVAGIAASAFPRLRILGLTGPGPHALAEFPDLTAMPWLQDVRIWKSQIAHVPSLRGSHMDILELDDNQITTLDFDAGPLRWLSLFRSLTAISPQFTAPNLASLQISFKPGVEVSAANCPPDHPVPQVAATCKSLIHVPSKDDH